ncbi:tRNA modification GTPase [Phycisphaerales bacterium AB-hyl4]|uniref:tRNA modification GTPase MnmE n=1 Tax=Natronomicrosphaera hydrolytica TaxID=3242702 RepID=A0ABV4U980_9BACT
MPLHTTTHDTIAAVSSPPGRSLRGLLRLSGRDARAVLSQLIDLPADLPRRTLQRVRLLDPPMPALLAWFPGPHSYTGDDVAELQLPGHPALLDRVLHAMLAAGARLAEPGEFTFRGYLAGRFDLTQAEGIAATIAAVSDSQLAAATMLREGQLASVTRELVDELATVLALVEAGIDFVDQEDVVPIAPAELHRRLGSLANRLRALVKRSRSWGALEALPRVVLVGLPSVGKSTLFNALLGRERAVIDAQPGTTRDVLAEPMTLRDAHGRSVEVMLVDIAGLDRPEAALDEQVQAAAHRAIAQADLLLRVTDTADQDAPPSAGLTLPRDTPTLHVRTKADMPSVEPPASDQLHVSVHADLGLDVLRDAVARRIAERGVSVASDMLALQPRHEHALKAASEQLADALAWVEPQRESPSLDDVELIASHLRSALDALAGLGGEMTPDDVIGRVFATFCVGK